MAPELRAAVRTYLEAAADPVPDFRSAALDTRPYRSRRYRARICIIEVACRARIHHRKRDQRPCLPQFAWESGYFRFGLRFGATIPGSVAPWAHNSLLG